MKVFHLNSEIFLFKKSYTDSSSSLTFLAAPILSTAHRNRPTFMVSECLDRASSLFICCSLCFHSAPAYKVVVEIWLSLSSNESLYIISISLKSIGLRLRSAKTRKKKNKKLKKRKKKKQKRRRRNRRSRAVPWEPAKFRRLCSFLNMILRLTTYDLCTGTRYINPSWLEGASGAEISRKMPSLEFEPLNSDSQHN